MTESRFTSIRWTDGKQRRVIVDICGNVINRNPKKEELKGIMPELSKKEISTNEEYLLELLRYFYKKEGRVAEERDFNNNPKYPSFGTYQKVFGSWDNAIRKAGLLDKRKIIREKLYTDEELLESLRKFEREEGRPSKAEDFINNSKYPGLNTYIRRFRSWNNALRMAGLQTKSFTDEELLEFLRRFEREEGRSPTARDFTNHPKYPSFKTYQNRFGSWENALRLVCLDIDIMVKKGILKTNQQKARLGEIIVLEHFAEKAVDLAGENCNSPYDGTCPKNQTYDVKSSALIIDYYAFNLGNSYRDEIEWFYLLGFNEDYSELQHVWRILGDFTDKDSIYIGVYSNHIYNIENMKEYEITDKFKDINLLKIY